MNKLFIKILIISIIFFVNFNSYAIQPLPPFDWGYLVANKPPNITEKGQQILHFKTTDKPYTLNKAAKKIVKLLFDNAKELKSDAQSLRFASDNVTINGAYLELGVCTGRTINLIAALNPEKIIYGFDSFEGLPENWVRDDKIIAKGTFKFTNANLIPPVLENVKLFKGLFKDSLPKFIKEYIKNMPIALLHIDCDLYSATKEGLMILKKNIVPGTIIVLDEYYNYPGYKEHEYKALNEFLVDTNYAVEYLAFNGLHEQVVVRIIAKNNK